MTAKVPALPRVAALVGPFASGKTSLMEALLHRAEAIARQGKIKDGTTVGDASEEARNRQMSVEPSLAGVEYLGEKWTFIDCPGSVEFQQDTLNALTVVDAAVVVCEPDPARAVMVAPLLRALDEANIPHVLFINKIDGDGVQLQTTLEALQAVSTRPLVLRELPIYENDKVVGFVDLVSERAYRYHAGQASDLIPLPASVADDKELARQEMLEHLADFDDALMEKLLEDVTPAKGEVFEDISKNLQQDLIVPVLFGTAETGGGVTRLWKALRHDVPGPRVTAARLDVDEAQPWAKVFKTVHAAHTGKLSFVRVLGGKFTDGQTLSVGRISGMHAPAVGSLSKVTAAEIGDIVALGRLDDLKTGDVITADAVTADTSMVVLAPMFAFALKPGKKGDDVKLAGALTRLAEEDPSYSLEHNAEFSELVLWGQGEIHLQVALERLKSRYNLDVITAKPTIPYKETIRKSAAVHGRHRKQSGGHGQFGDVHIEIRPRQRGEGFLFEDKIVGGAIPRQYIPAVEEGVEEYLKRGPLGFPVVDVAVSLNDGSFHTVDSSDMAFKTAARIAMTEGMPQCEPVLLEPILSVQIAVPSEYTAKAQRIVSGRRGQLLGYDAREGWTGWDVVQATLPQAEMGDLIIELRSLTMGVGSFAWTFDHLQEISGRVADKVVEDRKAALAAA